MIFDWITGRSLSKITKGNTELEMMYDCNGMRTQKKVGNDITNYYYDSGNNLIGLTYGSNTLLFYYDSNGVPTSFAHNGTMYYYVKNLQGDIVQITKQDGTVVAKYVYDVWGKILSIKDGSNNMIETTNATHLANLNPFRYRGYVYDNETGLYYLQSRYYDPITGRFLNADAYCDTESGSPLSTNMFAYCENNSVIASDHTGYWGTYTHKDMTNCAGFKKDEYKLVRDWTYNADAYPCASTDNYSTPFHGRENGLDIGRKLYNLALEIKKAKKSYKFTFKDKESGCKSISFLKYSTKSKGNSNKTKNAQNSFLSKINKKSYSTQWKIFLGLSLHTLQDYFAHVVHVTAISNTDKFYGKRGKMTFYNKKSGDKYIPYMIYEMDDIMGIPNDQFEDNINVFRWRYDTAFALSKLIYKYWSNSKKIKSITASTRNEVYTYKTTSSYWRKKTSKETQKIYEKRYWVVTSYRYFYSVKTY